MNIIRGITKEQWCEFEELRRSGKVNMWGAARYLSFDYAPIMNDEAYTEMRMAWGQEFEEPARQGLAGGKEREA